jgi:type IV pilus assembly protein PilV
MNKIMRRREYVHERQDGFTILEVLVSLVILSIGLLGTAKLMLYSSHANDSAYLRSQATDLAYEILDNMRANRQQALAGAYTTALATAPVNPGFACTGATACSQSNLALYDVYTWQERLNANSGTAPAGALPAGAGSVAITLNGSQTTAVITVQWDDSAAQTAFASAAVGVATPMSITLETVL